ERSASVRIRKYEEGIPNATHVPDRELTRAHYREDRHRFRRTVHTRSPALAEKEKDRRDEGSGVTDTHPPYEVCDIPAPTHSLIKIPLASTINYLHCHRQNTEGQQGNRDKEPDPPQLGRLCLYRAANVFSYLVIVLVTAHQRRPYL